jgi:hypothetical protein
MARSKADRERERQEVDWRVRKRLLEALDGVDDWGEALKLALGGPGPDQPGRSYHSNLAFFLQQFAVPAGSDFDERAHYAKLIERLDAAGQLKPDVAGHVISQLREQK